MSRLSIDDDSRTEDETPEPPIEARAFSIAFGWIGLIVGGVAWVLYWGAWHLPKRGEEITQAMFEFTALDFVMLALLPFGAAALAGRWGRDRLP